MIFADGFVLTPAELLTLGTLSVSSAPQSTGPAFRIPKGLTVSAAEKKYISRPLPTETAVSPHPKV